MPAKAMRQIVAAKSEGLNRISVMAPPVICECGASKDAGTVNHPVKSCRRLQHGQPMMPGGTRKGLIDLLQFPCTQANDQLYGKAIPLMKESRHASEWYARCSGKNVSSYHHWITVWPLV
jgi:hypothetical protein